MKFRDYIKHLNNLQKKHPECLDYELVSSSDDEGNDFQKVYYGPAIGHFKPTIGTSGEFYSIKDMEENGAPSGTPNAICIN